MLLLRSSHCAGQWMPLTGGTRAAESPEVCIKYTFAEEPALSPLPTSPPASPPPWRAEPSVPEDTPDDLHLVPDPAAAVPSACNANEHCAGVAGGTGATGPTSRQPDGSRYSPITENGAPSGTAAHH
jgi:hypothetical protein